MSELINSNVTPQVSEENVANMIPVIGLNGEPVKRQHEDGPEETITNIVDDDNAEINQEEDDTLTESMDDVLINAKTDDDVDRETRKLIADIYMIQISIREAEDSGKGGNKEVIDDKRKFIELKKKLSSIKNSASASLKSSISKLESIAKKEFEKRIKKVKKDKDDEERVEEGVALNDFIEDYFTEMNHISGIVNDVIISNTLKNKKLFNASKKDVESELPDAVEKITEYDQMMKDTVKLFDSVYTKYKTFKIPPNKTFENIINVGGHSSEKSSGIYKYNNKFVVIKSNIFITYEAPYGSENEALTTFTLTLNTVRKICYEMQRLNKNKLVTIKVDAKDDKKNKIKFIILGAYLKTSLGTVKEKEESVSEAAKDEEKKTLPSELKRLDEKRGQLAKLEEELKEAKESLEKSGEKIYENKVTGLTSKISKLKKEIEEDEKKAEKIEKEVQESVMLEAKQMEDEIRPIVNTLEEKGYKVKYASPGHKNLRKKEDAEPDGVYYQKLYSDARIMFDDKYDFSDTPEGWHWREVDGCSYLDITPKSYKEEDGTPDEAFTKWKNDYMSSLKEFVNKLKSKGDSEKTESVDEFAESVINDIYDRMGILDDFEEMEESASEIPALDSGNTLLKELDSLLS